MQPRPWWPKSIKSERSESAAIVAKATSGSFAKIQTSRQNYKGEAQIWTDTWNKGGVIVKNSLNNEMQNNKRRKPSSFSDKREYIDCIEDASKYGYVSRCMISQRYEARVPNLGNRQKQTYLGSYSSEYEAGRAVDSYLMSIEMSVANNCTKTASGNQFRFVNCPAYGGRSRSRKQSNPRRVKPL